MPARVLLRTCFFLAAGTLLAAQQPVPGPPPVTFQVEVNFVDIDAVVTDERGNFVGDLTKEDFELLEDGRRQEISTFSVVDIPRPTQSRATAPAVAAVSDVKS